MPRGHRFSEPKAGEYPHLFEDAGIVDALGRRWRVASKSKRGADDPRREVARAILAGRLTRAEAARELGLSKEAVSRWVRRERSSSPSARSRFVSVSVRDEEPSAPSVVEVVLLSGVRLRVSTSSPDAAIVRLARALDASC